MSRRATGGDTGFALILVVWVLVLIGAISAYLVANGRAETAIAFNVRAAASAEALADAGIARAVFNETNPRLSDRWKLDGALHRIIAPSGTIEIRLEDENQKINVNLASSALRASLFQVTGTDGAVAKQLGAAVADWVNAKPPANEAGANFDPYRAAGRKYGPPHAPAESLDELQLVIGMTPAIFASVRPYLTIHTSAPAPDAKTAPLIVQRALALAARIDAEGAEEAPAQPGAPTQGAPPQLGAPAQPGAPAQGAAAGDDRVISALVTGRSREGGVFQRYAVLRLEPDKPQGYSVLDWQRGALDERERSKLND